MDVASCPPLRTSAANALWGHLLRKDVASGLSKRDSSAISNPPIAPSDRTGTSLRILLHDTQANLEKFSERVNLLIDDVEGTKREVVTVRKAFEDEHEKLINETTDLVNRCQAEIRKHVGSPAQTSLVEDVQKTLASLDHKVNGLEQKLDVLQMMNQTQTQALQTLQEQQGQMLLALAPLLPLVQAIPVHVENAQNRVVDVVQNVERIWRLADQQSSRTTEQHLVTRVLRSPSVSRSSPSSLSGSKSRKRRRLDQHPDDSETPSRTTMASPHRSQENLARRPVSSDSSEEASSAHERVVDSSPCQRSLLRGKSRGTSPDDIGFSSLSSARTQPGNPVNALSSLDTTPVSGDLSPANILVDLGSRRTSGANKGSPVVPKTPASLGRAEKTFDRGLSECSLLVISQDITHVEPTVSEPPASHMVPLGPTSAYSFFDSAPERAGDHCSDAFAGSCFPPQSSPLLKMPPHRLQQGGVTPSRERYGSEPLHAQSFSAHRLRVIDSSFALGKVVQKPMSLRDRRALFSIPSVQNEGKRFIAIDDDDDAESSQYL